MVWNQRECKWRMKYNVETIYFREISKGTIKTEIALRTLHRLGFFAHRPQDMWTKNVRPCRSQSFKTIKFQLLWILCPPQSLLVSQHMVCEAGPIHRRKKWPPRGQKFSDFFKFFKLGLTELTSASGRRPRVRAVYLSLGPSFAPATPPLSLVIFPAGPTWQVTAQSEF